MQRFLAGLIATTLLASAPIHAQQVPAPLKDCRALLKSARGDIERTPQTEIEDLEDGCRFTQIGFALDTHVTADIDEMIIRSPDLLAVWPTGDVFEAADLTLNGFSVLPGYKTNLRLVYDTDPEALTANIERLHFDAGPLGAFTVSARFSQFDNTDLGSPLLENQGGIIHSLDISLHDSGLGALLLLSLQPITGLPSEDDVIAMSTIIRAWPERRLSTVSAESLVRFLTAIPDLIGDWTFSFESQTGLAIKDLAAANFAQFAGRLPKDSIISATAAKR
ncbi:hypothetical protein [Devosia sp. Leaf64]|uniref:hypothetical protein n=1 Tax=Devosia sp. Leaf64 TaxID=1736229 RepID=UPI00071364AD|nr:hypothetical protein [Devosia sp. Leaf64]KQN73844.1 hypothetical protein ASE94_06280 [Devosia sp. Leaf64]